LATLFFPFGTMECQFAEKWWTMTLKDGAPEYPPIPKSCMFSVKQIEALTKNSEKITIEMMYDVIRMDKVKDEGDTAVTDVARVNIATIFPKRKADAKVNLQFSQLNSAMFGVSGGDVVISGAYSTDGCDEVMENFENEE
jgi:hypothetical protein